MNQTLLKPTSKGQVTIPSAIRKIAGIDKNTYLSVYLDDNLVIFKPVKINENLMIREYTDEEIDEFLENDQINPSDEKFFRDLLKS